MKKLLLLLLLIPSICFAAYEQVSMDGGMRVWTGKSTETSPSTATHNLDKGELLYQTDKGRTFTFNGAVWEIGSIGSNERDETTGAATTIPYEHHEIHSGSSYTTFYQQDVTDIGDISAICFETPDTTKYLHITASASASAIAHFMFVEAPSVDAEEATAQQTPYNRSRNSTKTSGVLSLETSQTAGEVSVYDLTDAAGANITTTTQLIHEHLGAAGSPVSKAGGSARAENELILKRATEYCAMLEALDANDNSHNIILNWYEHTDIQ